MDGLTLVLNVAVAVWMLLGLICLVEWYLPSFGRYFYLGCVIKFFFIATAVILALAGLLRFVRMEE